MSTHLAALRVNNLNLKAMSVFMQGKFHVFRFGIDFLTYTFKSLKSPACSLSLGDLRFFLNTSVRDGVFQQHLDHQL